MPLNNLSNNKKIIIQKSDKGNSVALLDKDKHLKGMYKILNNNAKFELLQFDHDKELSYVLNLGKKVTLEYRIIRGVGIIGGLDIVIIINNRGCWMELKK